MADLDDGWWECSQCGAMSMHVTRNGQPECVNCDVSDDNLNGDGLYHVNPTFEAGEVRWRLPWWTIFWCCLIGAACWAFVIWWIFYA